MKQVVHFGQLEPGRAMVESSCHRYSRWVDSTTLGTCNRITDDPKQVTCEHCKKTHQYRNAKEV